MVIFPFAAAVAAISGADRQTISALLIGVLWQDIEAIKKIADRNRNVHFLVIFKARPFSYDLRNIFDSLKIG
jgi:hypothetical protein